MSVQLTAEEAAAALGSAPKLEEFICLTCGRVFDSQAKLNGHQAWHKTPAGKQAKKPEPPKQETQRPITAALAEGAKATVEKAVRNTKALGHFPLVMALAPHTGLALAGLKDEGGRVIVRSRAELAGQLIMEIRDAEVLRQVIAWLERYNALFELSAAADLVGSLAVAGAVDARVIPPDFTVKLPVGGMQLELPVVQAAIGDVTAELAARGLYETPEAAPETPGNNGQTPGGEQIAGGVEST